MTRVRKIVMLQEVEIAKTNPYPKPRRLKGAKAAGIAFERKFHRALPSLLKDSAFEKHDIRAGEWLEYTDRYGKGYAQPDFYLLPPKDSGLAGIIIETKLSLNTRGFFQLEQLYYPLLCKLYPDVEWKKLQVCKNMKPGFGEYPQLPLAKPFHSEVPDLGIWHYISM